MSTRFYPIYQTGGPQLRVFLSNFWMKIVKPKFDLPPNIVQFSVSMEMTKYDIQNYLAKIYNIHPVDIRTNIPFPKTYRHPITRTVIKDPDVKYAYVVLRKDEVFKFPDLYPEVTVEKRSEEKYYKQYQKMYKKFAIKNVDRPYLPGWFSV